MKIKTICVFKELLYGTDGDPSIKDYISNKENANKDKIINYLNGGVCVAACTAVVSDVINEKNGDIGTPDALTDGKFQWYADLSYYVEKYNLELPKEFIDNMVKNNWKIPITDKDIGEDIEYI